MNGVIIFSLAALLLMLLIKGLKAGEWRQLAIGLITISGFAAFLNRLFGFPFSTTRAMGPQDMAFGAALYLGMLAGILSQYVYRRLASPARRRPNWDWGLFFGPVFASPIVFIPLWAAFEGLINRLQAQLAFPSR
jgi:hypothetical protein